MCPRVDSDAGAKSEGTGEPFLEPRMEIGGFASRAPARFAPDGFSRFPNDERNNRQSRNRVRPHHMPKCADNQPHQSDQRKIAAQCRLRGVCSEGCTPVTVESRRFSLAMRGMHTAAIIRMAIPRRDGLGSLYPSNAITEVTTTHAASANSSPPAIRAALRSVCTCAALALNLQSTTVAEASSIALSPPNASSAGLRTRHAAKSETAASTLIQTIVIA